jgi:hypothetical protein
LRWRESGKEGDGIFSGQVSRGSHIGRMLELFGIHQKGTGTATPNLATQLPLIAKEFPEVAACHHGTINLNLDSPLFVIAPDHRTKPIHWNDKDFPDGEVFDWLRIRIEAPGGSQPGGCVAVYPAWFNPSWDADGA